MANVYLHRHDQYLKENLHGQLHCHFRYIDDGLMLVDMAVEDDAITQLINAWNDQIQVKPVSSGDSADCLDLTITICRNDSFAFLDYRTYRKPQNIYSYVPANSEHRSTVFDSIVRCEARRLLRTNRTKENFERERAFFADKFAKRGHSTNRIRQLLQPYNCSTNRRWYSNGTAKLYRNNSDNGGSYSGMNQDRGF